MKRQEPVEEILQQCLQRLDAGEDITTCLRDYPDYRDVLAPVLAVAADVCRLSAPTLPAHVRTAARLRAHEALARQASASKHQNIPYGLTILRRRALSAVLAVVLVFGTFGATIAQAQQSLPGDVLYGMKRSSEQVRVQLTPGIVGRAVLYLGLADRRVIEPLALLAQGTVPSTETIGEILPAYDRAKDAIAQTQPADQVVLGERYNQLVDRHAREIETAFETTLPNMRDVLQEIQQATISAGHVVVPDVLSQNAPPVSPTAEDTILTDTASPIVPETVTAALPTQTQSTERTTTTSLSTPTRSGEVGVPTRLTPTRNDDRPGTVLPPVSTPEGRPPVTMTLPATPSSDPAVATTTAPNPTRDSGTAVVPGTPPPPDERGPTSTAGGSTPVPSETSTPRTAPTSTLPPSTEPTGRVTLTPSGEPTTGGPVPTLSAEPTVTPTVTATVTLSQTPSPGLVPTSTPTALPSPSPDATRTTPPYPGPESTRTLLPYPGQDATGTALPDPAPEPTQVRLPYPGPDPVRTTSPYPGPEQ